MKHAFLIMAHENPEQLALLLAVLRHERVEIFLHIDKNAPYSWQDVAEHLGAMSQRTAGAPQSLSHHSEEKTYYSEESPTHSSMGASTTAHDKEGHSQPTAATSHIHLITPPQEVHWGDVSQVDIELRLLAAAQAAGPFVHYHWLSGVDFLLRPVEEVLQFFDAHARNEFISFWNSEAHRRNAEKRTRYYYPFTAYLRKSRHPLRYALATPWRKLVLIAQKQVKYRRFSHQHFYKGYNWASVTEGFAQYLLARHKEILRTYRGVLAPDEIYKQTLVVRSPFAPHVFDSHSPQRGSQRVIDWERGRPYVFQVEDVPQLLQQPLMFVRKVSLACAQALMATIDLRAASSSTSHEHLCRRSPTSL